MSQTILITGATSGFGEAMARRFAAEGWKLIITGRRTQRLNALAAELSPAQVHTATFDIRDSKAISDFVAALPEDFKNIDVLVNNAGLALGLEPAQRCDLDLWETMIDTNIKGLVAMSRAVLPGMVERSKGLVVNLGSIAGNWPYPGGNVYGGTKAFVKQFSLNLRADLHGTGVRVTNIEPGMAETEFSVVRFEGDKDKAAQVYSGMKPLTGEDIADIVHYVATAPAHVNVNRIEVMPTAQSFGGFPVHREQS
ncbi:SDR family oxidoreductase [Desulfovibrio ferrophilus]|uniref:3-hydroxy acid dehydrogenase n=1 Tax=Desulfovibrio ferrophilus TaxID=241368 RepID=A0A2Z6AUM7_9BACT|nr:SDR family oxidoreductase [Desulfovibrio ferrophilus]BBD06942.1 3-hydroxy acid dehydrogenase [Desulfovibrio ferrophilus]